VSVSSTSPEDAAGLLPVLVVVSDFGLDGEAAPCCEPAGAGAFVLLCVKVCGGLVGACCCGAGAVCAAGGGGAGAGGGYFTAEGAVGRDCCGVSWATSPHGNAAANTKVNQ